MSDRLEGKINNPIASVVILTWNSEKYIQNCVKSYAKSFYEQGITAEFIIVDNGSSDNTVNVVEQDITPLLSEYCSIYLISLKKNQGTTISRNIGITKSKGKMIIICDSDTEFVQGEWGKVFSFIENDPSIGIVASSLFYEDGTIQNSVKKFPTLIDKLWKIPKIFFHISMDNRDFYKDFPWSKPKPVDSAISACWILSKKTISEIGLLDENIFYSPEDLDYCLRIWEGGKKVIFYPDIKLIHHTQQISHKKPLSRLALSHFKGLVYYFIKHRYLLSRNGLIKRIMGEM